jgi:hypothetical protein
MKYFLAFLAGWFGLLFVKYVLLGLDGWNAIFHPQRLAYEKGRGIFG